MSSTEEWNRFWEIDFARGSAVIGMIAFHVFYDMNFLGILSIDTGPAFWFLLAFPIAFTFILLVGISMVISYERRSESMTRMEMHKKYILRGLKIFGYGLLITLATRIFIPSAFVIFGILHFIGISVIISYLLLLTDVNEKLYLVFAALVSFAGSLLNGISFDFPWLLWLGFRPENFYTLDYFPLLPWFSVVLVGMFLGKRLYGKTRKFPMREPNVIRTEFIEFIGRHSLLIYLLHQPIIIGLVLLLA